jgi:hypothetical protein
VLLAAEGRSTRSIAEEVGVQPRIVSNWRCRFDFANGIIILLSISNNFGDISEGYAQV